MSAEGMVITGASGWLGQTLFRVLVDGLSGVPAFTPGVRTLRLLAQESDVDFAQAARSAGVAVVVGDVRSKDVVERLCAGASGGVLVHAAGLIHPRRVRDFYSVNVEGTANVLRAAARAGLRRAVVVSSNSPCGCNPDADHVFDEFSPYHPYMNYGRSKMLMEQAARKISAATGLELVIVRAPWFYGPFHPARQAVFFRMIRDGRAPIVGRGSNRRSMAYTENLAQGILAAAARPQAAGRLYWIADERSYSMSEIVDTIERLLETEFGQQCRHTRLKLPRIVCDAAFAADWMIQATGHYHQKIHVLSEMDKTIACSIRLAREELDYRPAVDLEQGMRLSLQWQFETAGGL